MNTLLTTSHPVTPEAAAPLCIREILVPIDFSEHSDFCLRYAIRFAECFSATITLLHVVTTPVAYPDVGATYPSAACMNGLSEAAQERISRLCEQEHLTLPRLRRTIVRVGLPHEAIAETASERGADLIILATHGRTGLAHVLHGSVAEQLVREAPCPVLVLHAEHQKFIAP